MYVINPKNIDEKKIYSCGGVIANYLIIKENIPLLGQNNKGIFYFSKTKKLEESLSRLPFYLNILKILY